MSADRPSRPVLSPHGEGAAEQRRRRQAQALRANLGRRKAQERSRDQAAADAGASPEGLENHADSGKREDA